MAKNDHFYHQKRANPNQKEQILTDFDGRLQKSLELHFQQLLWSDFFL